jgi:hypothetical protein
MAHGQCFKWHKVCLLNWPSHEPGMKPTEHIKNSLIVPSGGQKHNITRGKISILGCKW